MLALIPDNISHDWDTDCMLRIRDALMVLRCGLKIPSPGQLFDNTEQLSRLTEFSIRTKQPLWMLFLVDAFSRILFLWQLHLHFYVHYCINITLKCVHFVQEMLGFAPTETFGEKWRNHWHHDVKKDIMTSCSRWCMATFPCTGQSRGNFCWVCKKMSFCNSNKDTRE